MLFLLFSKPIACLGYLTIAANQTCRKSWFSREKKAVTADSRHFNEKKNSLTKISSTHEGRLLYFGATQSQQKKKITRRYLQNICFSLAGFPTTLKLFILEPQSLSWTKTEKQKHPFFWFYHLRSWWKKRTKFLSLPWPFFAAGASRKWPFLTAMNPTHDVDDPLLVEVQGRKI